MPLSVVSILVCASMVSVLAQVRLNACNRSIWFQGAGSEGNVANNNNDITGPFGPTVYFTDLMAIQSFHWLYRLLCVFHELN